jgi:hypothetical protein
VADNINLIIVRLEKMLSRLSGEDKQTIIGAIDALGAATGQHQTPQRELYEALFQGGVEVRTEVRLPSKAHARGGWFRADIAVYRAGAIVALCECKSWARELSGRQRRAYDACGYPYIVAGKDNVPEALAWLMAKARGE